MRFLGRILIALGLFMLVATPIALMVLIGLGCAMNASGCPDSELVTLFLRAIVSRDAWVFWLPFGLGILLLFAGRALGKMDKPAPRP